MWPRTTTPEAMVDPGPMRARWFEGRTATDVDAVGDHTTEIDIAVDLLEGVIESVTHEDAGCWNCVYERQHPARGDFYRRVLQCNGDRDARVVRAS